MFLIHRKFVKIGLWNSVLFHSPELAKPKKNLVELYQSNQMIFTFLIKKVNLKNKIKKSRTVILSAYALSFAAHFEERRKRANASSKLYITCILPTVL